MKEWLIYLIIFISVAFMFVDADEKIRWFFWEKPHISENVAYHLYEHLIMIIVFHVIQTDAVRNIRFYRSMFWYQVADSVDFILTYNDLWIKNPVVSMNIVGAVVCGIFLVLDKIKNDNINTRHHTSS